MIVALKFLPHMLLANCCRTFSSWKSWQQNDVIKPFKQHSTANAHFCSLSVKQTPVEINTDCKDKHNLQLGCYKSNKFSIIASLIF